MAVSANKVAWTYTDDDGNDWRVAASKGITDQVNGSSTPKCGGTPAAATVARLPQYITPRKRYVISAAGVRRAVVCMDKTCDMWLVPGTTINLQVSGTDTAFTRGTTYYNERKRDTTTSAS